MGVRDKLALERTRLANERTLLAYIRTGLSLLACSAVLLHFFVPANASTTLAWILGGLGFVILGVGLFRFNKVRRELNDLG